LLSACKNILIKDNLIEANGRSGIMVEYLQQGSQDLTVVGNLIQYNNGFGIESWAVKNGKFERNRTVGNGNHLQQEKISSEKTILMD